MTSQDAWGVVATYHVDEQRSLQQQMQPGGSDLLSSSIVTNSWITPTPAYDHTIYVSSNQNLKHDGSYKIQEHITKTNAIQFKVSGSTGTGHHDISVSGQGLRSGVASVDIVPEYVSESKLGVTLIPVVQSNTKQDIAMVSILDETNSMIDVYDTFDRDTVKFLVSAADNSARIFDDAVYPVYSNTAIVEGVLSGPDTITAVFDGVASTSVDVSPFVGGVETSLQLLAPDYVHIHEKFPFAVHVMNPDDTPIQRVTVGGVHISSEDIRVTSDDGSQQQYMVLEQLPDDDNDNDTSNHKQHFWYLKVWCL